MNKLHFERVPHKRVIIAGLAGLGIAAAGVTISNNQSAPKKVEHVVQPEIGNETQNIALKALTDVITGVKEGKPANVTTEAITLDGPINEASGHPIVFNAGGQTFVAYTQESKPNFDESAAVLASSMAITLDNNPNEPTSPAVLNKGGVLIESLGGTETPVGFATGGDQG